MNLNTFNTFRHQVYACFESAADALLTEASARSLVELSLSPPLAQFVRSPGRWTYQPRAVARGNTYFIFFRS
jgi:hypothetical protein